MMATSIAGMKVAFRHKDWPLVIQLATQLLHSSDLNIAYMLRGKAFLYQRLFAQARSDLERALLNEPESVSLRVYAAQANVGCGDIGAGMKHLEELLQYDPQCSAALKSVIAIAERTGLIGAQAEAREQLLRLEPNNIELACDVVCCYLNVGMKTRADSFVSKAKKVSSSASKNRLIEMLIKADYWSDAGDVLQGVNPSNSGLSWFAIIHLHLQSGHVNRAQEIIEEHCSDELDARIWAAKLASWRGEYSESLHLLNDVPDGLSEKKLIRASIALQQGEMLLAIELAQQLISLDQENREAWSVLGEAQRHCLEHDKASHSVMRAQIQTDQPNLAARINDLIMVLSSADSENPVVYWDIADVLRLIRPFVHIPERDPAVDIIGEEAKWLANALSMFLKQMNGNRSNTPTWFDLSTRKLHVLPRYTSIRASCAGVSPGLLLFSANELLSAYDSLEECWGKHPLISTYRAEVKLWSGQYLAAERDLRGVISMSKRVRWAYNGLALALSLQGQSEEALAILALGKQYFRPLAASLVYEAEILYRVGEFAAAREKALAAIEAHPSRISAWLLGALCDVVLKQKITSHHYDAQMKSLCPQFWHQLIRESRGMEAKERWLHGLHMMRGNRSSQVLTWHTNDDRMWWQPLAKKPRKSG